MRADEARMQRGQLEESEEDGGPEGIRTLGRPIKSRTLYLAELQARIFQPIYFSLINLIIVQMAGRLFQPWIMGNILSISRYRCSNGPVKG